MTIQELDTLLRSGTPFRILKQQTYQCDLEFEQRADLGVLRIRFLNKLAHFDVSHRCEPLIGWYASHPALSDYHVLTGELYLSQSPVSAPDQMMRSIQRIISEVIDDQYDGWYSGNVFLNTIEVLECGYGMVLSGPVSIVDRVSALLDQHGLRSRVLRHRHPRAPGAQILFLRNYAIIANEFRVESVPQTD